MERKGGGPERMSSAVFRRRHFPRPNFVFCMTSKVPIIPSKPIFPHERQGPLSGREPTGRPSASDSGPDSGESRGQLLQHLGVGSHFLWNGLLTIRAELTADIKIGGKAQFGENLTLRVQSFRGNESSDFEDAMDLEDFWKTLELKKRECTVLIENDTSESSGGCRTTWDGIYCWPRSKPGELAQAPCPGYISGFDLTENATKFCTNNGWWVRQDLNVTWTNYTGCYHNTPYLVLTPFDVQLQTSPLLKSYIPVVKSISQFGYGISLVALLLAFTILAFSKRLRCPRNLLHLHLFVSFIMRASMALLKDSLFVEGVGLRHDLFYLDGEVVFTFLYHKWECKMFTVLWQYFILANYSWILMEGIYLHNLTFMAMFFDTSSIFWHVTMGWTLPAIFVIPWAIVRAFYEDTFCWTTHTNKYYFYIIKAPIIVSILVNLILFINIIRVVLKKLNSTTALILEPRITKYRKWAKSTLILMPLYGVHYALLLGMSYSDDPTVEIVWLISDQLFGSSQGFCVALLYCILNGEVMNEMSRKWHILKAEFGACSLVENSDIRSKDKVDLGEAGVGQNHGNIRMTAC